MYTIFKNDLSIILTDDLKLIKENDHLQWQEYLSRDTSERDKKAVRGKLYLYHKDLSLMWREFQDEYRIIEASGGIVRNNSGELLCIFRRGKWDLPKGKIESGETRESAALREVREECGFQQLDLGKSLGETYHVYPEADTEVLKISYWYEMFSTETDLSPQLEEDITDLKWVSLEKLENVFENTFPNIILLLKRYMARA